ncbi:MAG: alpha/beta fold hydrolase [Candidatus Marinimicrobia bacterium]|nr:alpha/beta fold hydrolase [Candidatus Neomarinimicrobiota bacterium]
MILKIVGLTVILLLIISRIFLHLISKNPHHKNKNTPESIGLSYKDLSIPTENNKNLHAWYIENINPAPAMVLIMHGWGRNGERMLDCANELYQEGYDILLPDARNHGDSDKDFYSSIKQFRDDILKSVDYAGSKLLKDKQKLFILGHSIGGAASILAAGKSDKVSALVTSGAFSDPETMIKFSLGQFNVPYFPIIYVLLKYIQYRLKTKFEFIRPEAVISQVNIPCLLVHGSKDSVVPVSEFKRLKNACPKCNTLLIDSAGHSNLRKYPEFFPGIKSFFRNNC